MPRIPKTLLGHKAWAAKQGMLGIQQKVEES